MFKLKLKKEQNLANEKIIENSAEQTKEQLDSVLEQANCEDGQIALFEQAESCDSENTNEENKDCESDAIMDDLSELATLLSTTAENLKEEFYLIQIRKIMSKIQKAIVRYDVTESELDKMFYRAGRYGLGGLTVAPVYLPACIKQNKKNLTGKLNVNSIIDFPFGESSLKGKLANIKESVKAGANSVAVTVPSLLLAKENLKQLKKECRKFYACSKKNAGIVLNASDVTEENFVEAMKALKRTKISYIVLAFGDATIEEVKNKLSAIAKCGITKKLYVLANVDRVTTATELFKLNVDSILTPYADDIGLGLLKRFNLINK